MTDVNGNELEVGDLVAVTRVGYVELVVCRILGFTPKKIKVNIPRYKYYPNDFETKFPNQIALLEKAK